MRVTGTAGFPTRCRLIRWRQCPACAFKCTTYEEVPVRGVLMIHKRNGTIESFDKDKLVKSIKAAMAKRPIPFERFNRMMTSIVSQVSISQPNELTKVTSKKLAMLVMSSLKALDEVSYLRYASVHFRFHSRDDFRQALDVLDMRDASGAPVPAPVHQAEGPVAIQLKPIGPIGEELSQLEK